MKKLFLMGIGGMVLVASVGYFLWRVLLACYDVYDDWRFGKELKELERDVAQRRRGERSARAVSRPKLEEEGPNRPLADDSP